MTRDLGILVDQDISQSLISKIVIHLKDIFPINTVAINKSIKLPKSCWNESRSQFDADCLLAFASTHIQNEIVLLIISKDAYVSRLNFVFGIASKGLGAVVSVYRLENDLKFVQKEIYHELGHVFGLEHCSLPCVMTFSNSVWEAKQKREVFCKECKKKIIKFL